MSEKRGKYVEYRCTNCGKWYKAKNRDYKPTCSDKCGFSRNFEAVNAMHYKEGPMYDKWLARTKAARQHQQRMKGG